MGYKKPEKPFLSAFSGSFETLWFLCVVELAGFEPASRKCQLLVLHA